MTDYTKVNNFTAKDDLPAGDSEKDVLGADWDDEFAAIDTAIDSKYDSADLADLSTAQAGSSNDVLLTPLRLEQEIIALRGMLPARLDLRAAYDYLAAQASLATYPSLTNTGLSYALSAAGLYLVTGVLVTLSSSSLADVSVVPSVSQTPQAIGLGFRDAADALDAKTVTANNGVAVLPVLANGVAVRWNVRGLILAHATLDSTLTIYAAGEFASSSFLLAESFLRLSRIA